jgi:uncharacterized FlaG/YvyC family protein
LLQIRLKLFNPLPMSVNKGIVAFPERFAMEITSTKPSINVAEQAPQVAAAEAAQRRQLIRASRSVNESGLLGRNQLVFLIDRATHRPVIRVEDRETHEVILQLPPEYVLRLAQDLTTGSAQMPFSADM